VNALVAMAVGHMMIDQVEDLVQLDKAPNLYWALADLPRPFINLRRPLQGEKVTVASLFPEIRAALKDPNHSPIAVQTINNYLKNLHYVNRNVTLGDLRLMFAMTSARAFPNAKKYLLDKGFTAERIAAMPVTQVSLMYSLAKFDEIYDETYKWHSLPYWQARPGIVKARQQFFEQRKEQADAMFLPSFLMPALDNVVFGKARLERRLAMLQTVEAVRLQAAVDGRLPQRLEDIRDVPVPTDPVTGKKFEYTWSDGQAVLYAPPPEGEPASDRSAVRYELRLANGNKN
jgi:hypothetical protein